MLCDKDLTRELRVISASVAPTRSLELEIFLTLLLPLKYFLLSKL